jgi:hypothetical protein
MLLTRRLFRNIMFESLLLEVKLKQIMGNPDYPLIDLYAKDVARIKNQGKYLGLLDRCLSSYVSMADSPFKDHDYIGYGEIIFCILMHEKYSGSDVIPKQFKDPQKIEDYKVLVRIIEDADVKFISANGGLYSSLTRQDKTSTEAYKKAKEEGRIEAQEEELYPDLNIDLESPNGLKPGLTMHAIIDGEDGRRWAIYRPYTVAGAQAIGIQMWCTVYSSAWGMYVDSGKTLYYVALYDPNRQYTPYAYSDSACRSDPKIYKNNFSIGYSGNRLVIPSNSGGTSVWANQSGVTYDVMHAWLGKKTTEDILAYIDGHFKTVGPASKKASKSLSSADQEERRQEVKKIRAPARSKKVFQETLTSIGDNDDRVAFVFNILRSPHLDYPVLEYIINRSFPMIKDSKIRQSEFYKAGVLQNAIVGLIQNAHIRLGVKDADAVNKLRDWALDNPELNSNSNTSIIHPLVAEMNKTDKIQPKLRANEIYHFVNNNMFGNPRIASRNQYGTFLRGFAGFKNLTERQGEKLENKIDMDTLDLDAEKYGNLGEELESIIKNLTGAIQLKTPGVVDVINTAFERGKYDKFIEENWPAILIREFDISGLDQRTIKAVIRDYVHMYIIHPGNTSPFKLALFEKLIKDTDTRSTQLAIQYDASREGKMQNVFKEEVYSQLSEEAKAALEEWKILWYKTYQNNRMRNNARLVKFTHPEVTKNYLDMTTRRHDLGQKIKEMLAAEGVDPKIVLKGGEGHEYVRNVAEFALNQEEFETVLKQGIATEKNSKRMHQFLLSVINRGKPGLNDYRAIDDRSYAVDKANQIKSGVDLVMQKCDQVRKNPDDMLWDRDQYGVYSNREDNSIPKGELYKLVWACSNITSITNTSFSNDLSKLIRFELMLDREFFSDFMHKVFIGTSGGGPLGRDEVRLKIGELRDGLSSAIFEAYVYMHPAIYGEDASKAIAFAEEIEQIVLAARERSIETCKAYGLRDDIDTSDVNFLRQQDYSDTSIAGRQGISSRLKNFPGDDDQGMDAKTAARIRESQEQQRVRN